MENERNSRTIQERTEILSFRQTWQSLVEAKALQKPFEVNQIIEDFDASTQTPYFLNMPKDKTMDLVIPKGESRDLVIIEKLPFLQSMALGTMRIHYGKIYCIFRFPRPEHTFLPIYTELDTFKKIFYTTSWMQSRDERYKLLLLYEQELIRENALKPNSLLSFMKELSKLR